MRRLVALALSLLSFHHARAWQGMCRTAEDIRAGSPEVETNRLTLLERYLCESNPGPLQRSHPCEEGLGFARGVQLGEHTWITAHAMRLAGIAESIVTTDDVFYRPLGGRRPPGYFVSGARVAAAGAGAPSMEPASSGAMIRYLERRVALAELSEAADGGHSLSSYVLGNEHCLAAAVGPDGRPTVPRDTVAALNRCNTFGSHLGALNATHWPPLHREMYRRYHAIALAVAGQCKRLAEAASNLNDPPHPLRGTVDRLVLACEREALAFESYAAHFLEDAWSSGHMFVRWGSPHLPVGADGQLRAWTASLLTGFIHGTRAIFSRHDQVCRPGPREPSDPSSIVTWKYPFAIRETVAEQLVFDPEAAYPGGGDLYLRACTAVDQSAEWSVASGAALKTQFKRMTICVASGFREVLRAGSLRLVGGRLPAEPEGWSEVFSTFPLPDDDRCWMQRLTNRSLMLGLGGPVRGTDLSPADLMDPGIITRWIFEAVPEVGSEALGVELSTGRLQLFGLGVAEEAARVATYVLQEARRMPEGTSLSSSGRAGPLDRFLGVKSTDQFEADVREDRVVYLEHDRTSEPHWSDRALSPSPCGSDDACPAGTYCDRAAVSSEGGRSAVGPRCVRHEGALLRAFRQAEIAYWCRRGTVDDIETARAACRAAPAPSDACDGCVQVVLPHLRNASSRETFDPVAGGRDRRSICDVLRLGNGELAHYRPYNDEAGAIAAAGAYCRAANDGGHELGSSGCPSGTVAYGAAPPRGYQFTCRRPSDHREHGPYLQWHANGTLRTQGAHLDGLLDGVWREYDESGRAKHFSTYRRGRLDGPYATYTPSTGKPLEEGSMGPTGHEGRRVLYFANGLPRSIEHYRNGKLDGLRTQFAEDGSKRSEAGYAAGQGDGPFVEFHPNGRKVREGTLRAGAKVGTFSRWYDSGQLQERLQYQDDKLDGLAEEFYPNGMKRSEGHNRAGRKVGRWSYYRPDGSVDHVNHD